MKVVAYYQLRHGYNLVSVLLQLFKYGGQSLRRMQRGVVKQYNRAGFYLFQHSVGNLLRRKILPVKAIHIPLNGIVTRLAQGLNDLVVVVSVGGAEKNRLYAGYLFYLFIARGNLPADFLLGNLRHVRVRVRVIHDFVTRVRKLLYRFGVFVNPAADNKERGFNLELIKNIDKCCSVLVSPRRVKTDCDFLVRFRLLYAVNRQIPRRCGNRQRVASSYANQRYRKHRKQCVEYARFLAYHKYFHKTCAFPSAFSAITAVADITAVTSFIFGFAAHMRVKFPNRRTQNAAVQPHMFVFCIFLFVKCIYYNARL